jgi:hypothetical protein
MLLRSSRDFADLDAYRRFSTNRSPSKPNTANGSTHSPRPNRPSLQAIIDLDLNVIIEVGLPRRFGRD